MKCCVAILIFTGVAHLACANQETGQQRQPKMINYTLVQSLSDNRDGIDGLDNPRQISISEPDKKLFITSGDDNSLAVFSLDAHYHVNFEQVFMNSDTLIRGLEGASGVVHWNNARHLAVSSFYDGAIALFTQTATNQYQSSQVLSDNFSHKDVFQPDFTPGDSDTLRLLGAWDLLFNNHTRQLLIASYISDDVTVFDIDSTGKLSFSHTLKSSLTKVTSFGNPVSLSMSANGKVFAVLGFEQHRVTFIGQKNAGQFAFLQTLDVSESGALSCLNPQKAVFSRDGKRLYIACAQSNAVLQVAMRDNGRYEVVQRNQSASIEGNSLLGAGTVQLSSDEKLLFAAGEKGIGIVIFTVARNGELEYANVITGIEHVSSIALSEDAQYLFATSSLDDELKVFRRE